LQIIIYRVEEAGDFCRFQANKFHVVSGHHSADALDDYMDIGKDSYSGFFLVAHSRRSLFFLNCPEDGGSNYNLTHCHIQRTVNCHILAHT
jgi:hypothetical protein